MKTILEHLIDSLPADIAAAAIRNTDKTMQDAPVSSPSEALRGAFPWWSSKQGFKYWEEVYELVSTAGDFRNLESALSIKCELEEELARLSRLFNERYDAADGKVGFTL